MADLPLLPEAERDLVLHGWNATDAPFDADATLHGLIAAQAARQPDAAALTCDGRTLSYGALDRGPIGSPTCCAPRAPGLASSSASTWSATADRIVAALAVLKAGAAFLPLPSGGGAGHAGRPGWS